MRRFNPERELRKIQHGNKNKILYGIIVLLLIISIGSTYALYQVRYIKRIIYTKVAPFNNKDIELAVYWGDTKSSKFPERGSEYIYDYTKCDNDSVVEFNIAKWKLNVEASGPDKCEVHFKQIYKDNSGANVPELYQGLIPIRYENNEMYIADITDLNTPWYDYDVQEWANAVLIDHTNSNIVNKFYNGDGTLKINNPITEEDVLQMYVWIPRYKYQLFNVNNETVEEQEIQIQFENGIDNTGDIECKYTNNKNGTITEKCTKKDTETDAQNDDWYTHPAFTFKGTFDESGTELPGIWVGKFETSGNASALTIKPNIQSWRQANLKTMFDASRNIEEQYANSFNLDKTQIDTHMTKNIEWGVITYLTQSKYGRCDEQGKCTEVAANTNTDHITGYNDTGHTWETKEGQLASTTGNMYGIYDISGGAWDIGMGNMVNANGAFYSSKSGFITAPDSRYYDVYGYDSSSNITHQRGHLGDATREIIKTLSDASHGGWYDDVTAFLNDRGPWFTRGGYLDYGTSAGSFGFGYYEGAVNIFYAPRIVISVQDGEK